MVLDSRGPAPRLAKPSWKDPRLLIGILMVLASVAGVVALVGSAGRTVPVLVAKQALVVGQTVDADSFRVVQVQLGEVHDQYLDPGEALEENTVVVRMVPKDELVPRSSIGHTDALDRKPVSVSVDEPLPKEVVVGTHVDVWVSLPDERNGFQAPVLMLPGAEVAALNVAATSLGSGKNMQVMVLVTDDQMPKFLGAVANKAKVSVVWNPGAAR